MNEIDQKHWDDCMGCLAHQLQGSIPSVTITVFLTWRLHAATICCDGKPRTLLWPDFLQAGCLCCRPANSVKSLKAAL